MGSRFSAVLMQDVRIQALSWILWSLMSRCFLHSVYMILSVIIKSYKNVLCIELLLLQKPQTMTQKNLLR